MLDELGHESSVVSVAKLYRSIAATLVIDPVDELLRLLSKRQACDVW